MRAATWQPAAQRSSELWTCSLWQIERVHAAGFVSDVLLASDGAYRQLLQLLQLSLHIIISMFLHLHVLLQLRVVIQSSFHWKDQLRLTHTHTHTLWTRSSGYWIRTCSTYRFRCSLTLVFSILFIILSFYPFTYRNVRCPCFYLRIFYGAI